MTNLAWPEPSELRALCRLLAWQIPLPRLSSEELARVANLDGVHLPIEIPASQVEALRRRILQWQQRRQASLVLFHDPAYPSLLRQIARPPVALFVQGDVRCLRSAAVAIVGARAASSAYRAWTRDLAASLCRCGVVIGSGLARGIDAAAHEGALDAGEPTFAVVGAGCDVIYPPEHESLQARIEANGCVVSELPPGTPPRPWHFPSRNRILAGIVRAVVVVQAEHRSGALITARFALHENREVMAVPGDVQDPRSQGVHALLQQGAALVASAGDVLRALQWDRGVPQEPGAPAVQADPATLLSHLRRPLTPEALRARLNWQASRLQRCLLELELAGVVEKDGDGRVCRVRGC